MSEAIWRPRGNGTPKSWFEDIPHWELRATTADGSTSKRVGDIDHDPAEQRYWQEERDREFEYLEEAQRIGIGAA